MAFQYDTKKFYLNSLDGRDAHQSAYATRFLEKDLVKIATLVGQAEFDVAEIWGGATIDVPIRFLGEDPFDRLEAQVNAAPKVQGSALFRGDCTVAYEPAPSDIIDNLMKSAAARGLKIARIFDAANDKNNLITAILAANKSGLHTQASISYTTNFNNPNEDNGDVEIEGYVNFAKDLIELTKEKNGTIDSLCIKDPTGVSTPAAMKKLVTRLREEFPEMALVLHRHIIPHPAFKQEAKDVAKAAMEAGVTAIDTVSITQTHNDCLETYEMAQEALGKKNVQPLNVKAIKKLKEMAAPLADKYKQFGLPLDVIEKLNPDLLRKAAIPGGMFTNFVAQIKTQGIEPNAKTLNLMLERYIIWRQRLGTKNNLITPVTPVSKYIGDQVVSDFLETNRLIRGKKIDVSAINCTKDWHTPSRLNTGMAGLVLGLNGDISQYGIAPEIQQKALDKIFNYIREYDGQRKDTSLWEKVKERNAPLTDHVAADLEDGMTPAKNKLIEYAAKKSIYIPENPQRQKEYNVLVGLLGKEALSFIEATTNNPILYKEKYGKPLPKDQVPIIEQNGSIPLREDGFPELRDFVPWQNPASIYKDPAQRCAAELSYATAELFLSIRQGRDGMTGETALKPNLIKRLTK